MLSAGRKSWWLIGSMVVYLDLFYRWIIGAEDGHV
jgi:hypothetical protein